jgi:ribosomal-protein-alanine N-acetyltransferase
MSAQPPMDIAIRSASIIDLPELSTMAQQAGPAAQWTLQQWQEVFALDGPPRRAWLALIPPPEGAEVQGLPAAGLSAAGFLVAQCLAPDWELENMAVREEFRRRGVGAALIANLLKAGREAGAERVLLEVRASNLAAIAAYRRAGFELLARRPGYYSNPPEDALIMVHNL